MTDMPGEAEVMRCVPAGWPAPVAWDARERRLARATGAGIAGCRVPAGPSHG